MEYGSLSNQTGPYFLLLFFFSEHIMGLHCLVFLVLKASKPKRKGELKGISYFD